jgi:hypothetical protein
MHATYRIRSLQAVSPQQAGLSPPAGRGRKTNGHSVAAAHGSGRAAAADGAAAAGATQLFVGLVQHAQTGEMQVAAIMLGSSSLSVAAADLQLDGGEEPRQQHRRRQHLADVCPTALTVANGRCWVGTAGGDCLEWDACGGALVRRCGGGGACGGSVAMLCAMPSAEVGSSSGRDGGPGWRLVATTAGGACTLLPLL